MVVRLSPALLLAVLALALSILATTIEPALARGEKSARPTSHASRVARANQGTVGIISGGIGGTYIRIASDLAAVLNDGDRLRVLPIVGEGSIRNINDILYLRGVDIGIVQSDVLSYFKRQPGYRNIAERIAYITKLYNEELHVLAGPRIRTIRDLAGKKVNVGLKGSGTSMTAATVFRALGIKVRPVHMDQALAIEEIKRGRIAATLYVAGKPASIVANLKPSDGLHIVPVAYRGRLQESYLPTRFTHSDYPQLIPKGQTVRSIAVGAVMAVYNWKPDTERYRKVDRFIKAFFSKFDQFLKPPRHKKWREVNLAAKVPGWKRFSAAETYLKLAKVGEETTLKTAFRRFLDSFSAPLKGSGLSAEDQEALFRKFLTWRGEVR